MQYFCLILVTSVLVVGYFWSHDALRPKYRQDAEPIYRESLRLYRVGQDSESGKLKLLFRSMPIPDEFEFSTPTPMDSGKQVSVQGVVERFKGAVSQLNHLMRNHRERFFGHMDSGESGSSYRINLYDWLDESQLDPRAAPDLGAAPQGVWLSISASERQTIEDYLRFGSTESVESLLSRKLVHYVKKQADSPEPFQGTKERMGHFVNEVAQGIGELASDQIGTRALTANEKAAIRSEIRGWESEINEEVISLLKDLCVEGSESSGGSCSEVYGYLVNTDSGEVVQANTITLVNELLVCNLLNVTLRETGHLWLVGKLKWLELVFWTLFGVMTQALVQQGLFLVGAKGDKVWNPSDNFRVLAKLLYAPFLSVALFFGIGYFGETKELEEFANASLAPLMISFVLGMYPNTVYRIMRGLIRSLFNEEATTKPQKSPIPQKTKVALEQRPKTIQELAASLKETVKAPLSRN